MARTTGLGVTEAGYLDNHPTSDGAVLIGVQDNGPGIDEALRPRLFDPFASGKPGGKGLGLTLVAKIVADHGGLIEVASEPRRTQFRILLPMATTEEGT